MVHAAALDTIRPFASSPELVRAAIQEYGQTEPAAGPVARAPALLRRLLAERRRELDEVTTAMVASTDPEARASFLRLQTERLEAIRALKGEIDRAAQGPAPVLPGIDLMARLPELMRDFDRLWERIESEADRRMIVEAWIQSIECVCEPVAGRHGWRREVVRVVRQPWVPDP